MSLSTPRWWYRRTGGPRLLTASLAPLARIYGAATQRRAARAPDYDPEIPVVSVGNLTLGGAGKTPVTREILRLLRGRGLAAFGLSRGYGGSLAGPVRVDPARHSAADVGDEPLLLAGDGPFVIARDRAAGARLAVEEGAECLVLDDAHQNPSVAKTLSLVVVDGETRSDEWPFGDGKVFPAGPMREPMASGLARADAVVLLLPPDMAEPDPALLALFQGLPVLIARLFNPDLSREGRLFGFAGVAKPWKIERALKAAGAELAGFEGLPDHGEISPAHLEDLKSRAAAVGAKLVTTEKDIARLGPERAKGVLAFPVAARFDDPEAFFSLFETTAPKS